MPPFTPLFLLTSRCQRNVSASEQDRDAFLLPFLSHRRNEAWLATIRGASQRSDRYEAQ